jgi:hypothetical protein
MVVNLDMGKEGNQLRMFLSFEGRIQDVREVA